MTPQHNDDTQGGEARAENILALADRSRKFLEQPHTLDIGDVMQLVADMRKALSARVPTGWRTIDSAPKDGTVILGFYPDRTGMMARQDTFPIEWAYLQEHGYRWRNAISGWSPTLAPSHWMPLPNPPKTTQGDDNGSI